MAANDIFKEKPEKIIASGLMLDTGIDALATPAADPEIGQGKAKQTGNLRDHLWVDPIFFLTFSAGPMGMPKTTTPPFLKIRCCTVTFRKSSSTTLFGQNRGFLKYRSNCFELIRAHFGMRFTARSQMRGLPLYSPRHVQPYSLCSLYCLQAGSWHLTEIPYFYCPPMKLGEGNGFRHVCP